jgi:hypothetical protein
MPSILGIADIIQNSGSESISWRTTSSSRPSALMSGTAEGYFLRRPPSRLSVLVLTRGTSWFGNKALDELRAHGNMSALSVTRLTLPLCSARTTPGTQGPCRGGRQHIHWARMPRSKVPWNSGTFDASNVKVPEFRIITRGGIIRCLMSLDSLMFCIK